MHLIAVFIIVLNGRDGLQRGILVSFESQSEAQCTVSSMFSAPPFYTLAVKRFPEKWLKKI